MAVGKNITWIIGKGKAKSSSLYYFKAVCKNIKWGRGENQDLKIWGWGRISSRRELYTSLM